jgi:tRNA A37 threonylcarbamoyltransferase TsaD
LALKPPATKLVRTCKTAQKSHEVTMSQVAKHAQYGGVVPEPAREHVNIEQLGQKFDAIKEYTDAVAVASKVGLPPAFGDSWRMR